MMWLWTSINPRGEFARAVRPPAAAALSPTAAMPARNFRRGNAGEVGGLQQRQKRKGSGLFHLTCTALLSAGLKANCSLRYALGLRKSIWLAFAKSRGRLAVAIRRDSL